MSPLHFERPYLDQGIVFGLIVAFSLILVGMIYGGSATRFFDLSSALIVFGGTLGATLVHYSWGDLINAWRAFKEALLIPPHDAQQRIRYLVTTSQSVRANGLMQLEREARYNDDSFLKLAFELAVDGTSPEEMKRLLETEIQVSTARNARVVQLFDTMGSYAPALGLIGTVIGLVQMLANLSDPSTVGPAMSIALLTTFYGAILSNILFLPLAGKLKNRTQEEEMVKHITLEGALSLRREENSVVLEQRLKSFLSAA